MIIKGDAYSRCTGCSDIVRFLSPLAPILNLAKSASAGDKRIPLQRL